MRGPNAVARIYTDNAMVDSVVVMFSSSEMVVIPGAMICEFK